MPSVETSRLSRILAACLVVLLLAVSGRNSGQARPRDPSPGTGPAGPGTTLGRVLPLEDASGHALDRLHEALARAKARKGQARLVFYGASHTASDDYTGVIRRGLQRRYGDAGHGFVLPARPWPYYRHDGVVMESSGNWRADRANHGDAVADGMYGLAGVTVASSDPNARGMLATMTDGPIGRRVGTFEVWVLEQPEGGSLRVRIDQGPWKVILTAAPERRSAVHLFRVRDGPHRLEVRPVGDGEVRLFGVALERARPGVILDTLGIPGARAADHLQWDDALYREHLARRRPDLVALAYGTNESGDDDQPIEEYQASLHQVLSRIREVVPEASCLLIGPSDRPLRAADGTYGPRPRTAQVIEVQRRLAAEFGCAFFDLVAFMGGEMAMIDWVRATPPLARRDHVHFTALGYQRLGEALLQALLPRRDRSRAR